MRTGLAWRRGKALGGVIERLCERAAASREMAQAILSSRTGRCCQGAPWQAMWTAWLQGVAYANQSTNLASITRRRAALISLGDLFESPIAAVNVHDHSLTRA